MGVAHLKQSAEKPIPDHPSLTLRSKAGEIFEDQRHEKAAHLRRHMVLTLLTPNFVEIVLPGAVGAARREGKVALVVHCANADSFIDPRDHVS